MTESGERSKAGGQTGQSASAGEAGSVQENRPRDPRRDRLFSGLKDDARFLKNWASRPLTTGAVSPSGKALAERMARSVDLQSDLPVVELGPGTGAVTKALLQRGVPPQRIVAVEFSQDFCKLLRIRFPGCRILQGDAYALGKTLRDHGITQAACIVSSLPLFSRPLADRIALINAALSLMSPGGEFIQFSYALVPPVRSDELKTPCQMNVSPWIMLNLPPARVWRYAAAS